MGDGALILVVGPSGAGKDTLIAAAAEHLAGDERFLFPRRLVTRTALPAAEVHDTITRAEFDAIMASGSYTLAWEAHGLGYVVPQDVADAVAEGQIAVCNVSRRIIPQALARFSSTAIVFVDANPAIRAARLAGRGRETIADIERRLSREGAGLPEKASVSRIDNSGSLGDGIAAFCAAIEDISQTAGRKRTTA